MTLSSLPHAIYPKEKPQLGFTTLLHRFGTYERMRSAAPMVDDQESLAPLNKDSLSRRKNQYSDPESSSSQELKMELAALSSQVAKMRETFPSSQHDINISNPVVKMSSNHKTSKRELQSWIFLKSLQ